MSLHTWNGVKYNYKVRYNNTLNLCKCGDTKKKHYNNALGHTYSAGDKKNVVYQQHLNSEGIEVFTDEQEVKES